MSKIKQISLKEDDLESDSDTSLSSYLGSSDDEFFCYGITQDLIVELTKINKIKVPQIAEIVSLKDESLSILEFGERLNVEFIVTGNIMKIYILTVRILLYVVRIDLILSLMAHR